MGYSLICKASLQVGCIVALFVSYMLYVPMQCCLQQTIVHALNENLASEIHLNMAYICNNNNNMPVYLYVQFRKGDIFCWKEHGFSKVLLKFFFAKLQKKITTKEMADTNHGPVNNESCVGAVHSSEKVHLQCKTNTLKVVVGVLNCLVISLGWIRDHE